MKINIVGPESSGKTTLSSFLASHYGGVWFPEYALEYVCTHGFDYSYDDVCQIVEHDRLELSKSYSSMAFFDAGLVVDSVWLDVCYGKRPSWLTTPLPVACQADLYLLLRPDLPWELGPGRENGSVEARERLYALYLKEIQSTGKPYGIVFGKEKERLQCAIDIIDKYLAENHSAAPFAEK